MKKNTVKKVFIFFMIFLPIQYAMVGVVGYKASEPWPAFVFPGFKSVNTTTDEIEIEKPEFWVYGNGSKHLVDTKELFSGIKESQRLGFLRTNFADTTKVDEMNNESRTWLKERIVSQYPSVNNPQVLEVLWIREVFKRDSEKLISLNEEVVTQIRLRL